MIFPDRALLSATSVMLIQVPGTPGALISQDL